MILFDVTLAATAASRTGMVALLNKTMAASQAEAGCITYRFTVDLDDPLKFYLIELWETEEALISHTKGEAFRNFIAELPAVGTPVGSVVRQGELAPYQFILPA